jgi:LysR family transcriptional activator of glutamate synthase operon
MHLEQLRHLAALARHDDADAAARELGVAPAVLIRQLGRLERELGTPLLGGAALTPSGAALAQTGAEVLADLDDAIREIVDVHQRPSTLRVSLPSLRAGDGSEAIAPAMLQRFPNLTAQVETISVVDELIARLRTRSLDLGVLSVPIDWVPPADIASVPLFSESLVLWLPPGHPLGAHSTVPLGQLRDIPMVVHGADGDVTEITARYAAEAGFTLRVVAAPAEFDRLAELVAEGVGVAVVSHAYSRYALEGVEVRPIGPPTMRRTIVLLRQANRYLSTPERELVGLAQQYGQSGPYSDVTEAP